MTLQLTHWQCLTGLPSLKDRSYSRITTYKDMLLRQQAVLYRSGVSNDICYTYYIERLKLSNHGCSRLL